MAAVTGRVVEIGLVRIYLMELSGPQLRFIDFQTALPEPEVYARLNGKGLECTVRCPVEPVQAAATDQKMLQALREAQSKAPELQLVDGPLLDTSDN